MRLCSAPGCGRAIPEGTRFCEECQSERDGASATSAEGLKVHTTTDRERYAFLYRSVRWRRLREYVLRAAPWCQRCRRTLAAVVDHRVPAGVAIAQAQTSGKYGADRWAGFFIRKNLQGLCHACHSEKTAEDKAHIGEWSSVVA